MKISEKLSELKQKECEMMRLYDLRQTILEGSFKESLINTEKLEDAEIEKKRKEFFQKQKERVNDLNQKIEALREDIVSGRNIINRKNVENNVDRDLAEIKFLRIELSKLMKLIRKDRIYSRVTLDIDLYEELGLHDRVKELEKRKNELDAKIQHNNWNTDL